MFGVTPLPNSVQEALNQLCEVKNQPQPDKGVRRKLSLLSKQDALYVLEQIHNDRAPIKNTLGAFIIFMIEKLENASSSLSSPRLVWTASSSSQEHHQDYDRQPLYSSASYQSCSCPSVTDAPFYSSFQSQGETSNPLPATLCNGQSLCSSPSPYEILSAPFDAYKQFCERFQGVHISTFQTPSASPVTPVQLYKSFQGESVAHSPVLYHPADHGQAHLEAMGELEFRKQFLILSCAGGTKLKDVIDAEDIRNWKNLPMVKFETTVWHVLGEENVGKADRLLNQQMAMNAYKLSKIERNEEKSMERHEKILDRHEKELDRHAKSMALMEKLQEQQKSIEQSHISNNQAFQRVAQTVEELERRTRRVGVNESTIRRW